jgi:hypothetical protein
MCHSFLAGVIQMLMSFDHWSSVFLLEEEYRCMSPSAGTDTSQ